MRGRPIMLVERASGQPGRVVLAVGCIHGTECAGLGVTRRLLSGPPPKRGQLWVIPNLNPDGYALGARGNARGVDLNRNFPSEWRPIGQPGDPQYAGPRPLSERETRLAVRAIARVRPAVSIWFHQPQDVVRAWGQSIPLARRYARLAGAHFRRIRWPSGTASNWQNHRFPATASFVVELAAGALQRPSAARYARAVEQLL
jgi:protein MpaA